MQNSGLFHPRLYLSPPMEKLIGGATTLGLPVVPAGTSLAEYVTRIQELITSRIKHIISSFERRKQVIAQV